MAGISGEWVGASDILKKLGTVPAVVKTQVKSLMAGAAQDCYDGADADVPVGETLQLKESGHIVAWDNGDTFGYDVVYGDGVGYDKYGKYDGYT